MPSAEEPQAAGAPDLQCPKCGKLVAAPARFCDTCGKPLLPPDTLSLPPQPPPGWRRNDTTEDHDARHRHRRWGRRIFRLVLVACGIAAIYMLIGGGFKELVYSITGRHAGPKALPVAAESDSAWKVTAGQEGRLVSVTGSEVPLAADEDSIGDVVQATASKDRAALPVLVSQGSVILVPVAARVRVLDTSFHNTVSLSHVRVLDGRAEGKEGWVLAGQVDR